MDIGKNLSRLVQMLRPGTHVPDTPEAAWRLYRALVNTRTPGAIPSDFLRLQDETLQAMLLGRGVVDSAALPASPRDGRMSLWQGDITRLSAAAIVNAANEQMLGCFIPCHGCIDNAIHTCAGVQLREACHALMQAQGHDEPVGAAHITPGYNLPARFVLHTVGPIVEGMLTADNRRALAACYESCLAVATENALDSVAFCCISTGVYRFPKPEAAHIAVNTVRSYLDTRPTTIRKVIFNVYEESDHALYRRLLGFDQAAAGDHREG